ncbi:helix-turn-helix domain-containing protein [Bacillus zanthoxyli]|uniref:helix-turn-helix domain-containing protein n=1 Tax=Bacillus cereus group TaxID=86661 RepID=UPI00253FFBA8|nr:MULTISPECIES: helix-turn-helix transcriptional regulator [Bacillus cereus group]MDZ4541647.1 helix-turn-helix transcriptional regulator [Bacillus cereus]WIG38828.1 helix-turn-helix transcriptional regulator [Bacillus toyonensis]
MFGERLRKLRKENGLTMKELGRKLNLAESTISGYENGNRKPDYDTLNQFADVFDVSTDYLLERTDFKNNSEIKNSKDILNDPELGLWFKDIKNTSPDKIKELRQFWDFIKQKDNKHNT